MTPLGLFAKAPIPGKTKTRLSPEIGAEGAATLYRSFVRDTVDTCLRLGRVKVSLWQATAHPFLETLAEQRGLESRMQCDGDLGVRMGSALDEMLTRHGRGILIGTDTPTLPISLLELAVAALDSAELVLGPSADGGFYLIGARGRSPELRGIAWSSKDTLRDTLLQNPRGARVLPPWYDVDRPPDLRLLRTHLALDEAAAPHSRACLQDQAPASEGFDPHGEPG